MMKIRVQTLLSMAALLLGIAGVANAQEGVAASDVAQANNPLANFTAFNVHNYYIGELTDPDEDANQFWARFAMPFSVGPSNWLMRASLPVNTFPVPPDLPPSPKTHYRSHYQYPGYADLADARVLASLDDFEIALRLIDLLRQVRVIDTKVRIFVFVHFSSRLRRGKHRKFRASRQ
jgi:hypothetical protein